VTDFFNVKHGMFQWEGYDGRIDLGFYDLFG